MGVQPEISQRDLRTRSKEIMDSVEHGQSFTVTRDGHRIGELVPLRRRRTFIPREAFLAGSLGPRPVDVDRFRADLDRLTVQETLDPYGH